MNLNDLFRDLALNELSNLSMVDKSQPDTIVSSRRAKIVSLANEGLLSLYSKFVLLEKDVLVEMREAKTNYHLLKRYAWSNYDRDNPPDRFDAPYIMDTVMEPFTEDVIKVLSVHNTFGQKMPLNDTENPMSVFSPQANTLQVPFPIAGQALSIEYQAKHPRLDECECDDPIDLPDVLWPALKAYIAGKVYMHMNTQENTAKGQEHMILFDVICNDVVEKDLVSTSVSNTNIKLQKRGFV